MNTLSLVIQREYFTRVRKRSFIIMTLLMPLLMVALSFVPLWLSTLNDGAVKNIAVIDNTGMYAPLLKSTDQYQFQIINDAQQNEYQSKIGKDIFAILQITDDLNRNSNAVTILSEKQTSQELRTMVENALSEKVMEQRLDDLSQQGNVNAAAISEVRSIIESGTKISVKTMKWGDDGKVSESSAEIATIIGMVFTILIYMFILMYGNMVMQAVLEEKKSRVVEVMVSSVKPVNLLIGKIAGIGLVGITQLVIWGVLTGVLFTALSVFIALPQQAPAVMSAEMSNFDMGGVMNAVLSVNWFEIIVYFLLFFVGGYILYASIFAMFASAVDSEEDTSQFMMPVTIIIMFAFFAGFYSVSNPDGPLAFWGSLIPFTSPIVMMVRLPFGIPLWEKLLSLVLLYGTFILISFFAAKIYRVGILMYGKKPSIKEMMKWIKYK
ncbi:MAG TPA: ABC transporter permease [Petrimonas sp.]|uniref:ABC transporter permease n=1 Tax=Petrimonas sp. TaxID=2023866 RepID=UPI000968E692|nr:ABC transporter permease [Petrimonas sp.]MEA4978692.1 ABC transporter permease [Petrimonas sp.]OJV33314.1 MAG: ABC transporter permease [Bacteroidia bacterium 43-41]HHV86945.1 ABC transporter permease [Petrimonas sp.]